MRTTVLPSPLGELLLAAEGEALTGLWFRGQKHVPAGLPAPGPSSALPVFRDTAHWLELYFAGQQPDVTPPLAPEGTPFQRRVWKHLLTIPYGETVTYGAIAAALHSSPRAVGGAVGRNPISLLIPCHRVMGAGGAITGYAAGTERKAALLALEQTGTLPDIQR